MGTLFALFLLPLIGFLTAKYKLINENSFSTIPDILTNILYPAMIFISITSMKTENLLNDGAVFFILTAVITLTLFAVTYFVFKNKPQTQKSVMQFQVCIGNVVFVTIPLFSMFGLNDFVNKGIIFSSCQDLIIWSLFYYVFAKNRGSFLKSIISPCIISFVISLVLTLFKVPIPDLIKTPLSMLSSMTAPMALLFLGIAIYKYGLIDSFCSKTAVTFAIAKTFLLPLVIFVVVFNFLTIQNAILLALLFSAPTPLMLIVWSTKFKKDSKLASNCCVCSTIVYIITCSIFLYIYTSFS